MALCDRRRTPIRIRVRTAGSRRSSPYTETGTLAAGKLADHQPHVDDYIARAQLKTRGSSCSEPRPKALAVHGVTTLGVRESLKLQPAGTRCRRGSQIGADLGDQSRTRIELVPFGTPRQGPCPADCSLDDGAIAAGITEHLVDTPAGRSGLNEPGDRLTDSSPTPGRAAVARRDVMHSAGGEKGRHRPDIAGDHVTRKAPQLAGVPARFGTGGVRSGWSRIRAGRPPPG